MNNTKDISTKFTGTYRNVGNIQDLKIRIKIRESMTVSQEGARHDLEEIKTFKWQEKVFGTFEKQFYADEKNCLTDLAKSYHNIVSNLVEENNLLYSYTKEDEFYFPKESPTIFTDRISPFLTHMQSLPIVATVSNSKKYNYNMWLIDSIESPCLPRYCEELFHIMVDFGEYVDNTFSKFEYTVCRINYNKTKDILTIYPDFTANTPYVIQVNSDTSKLYEIFIENVTEKQISEPSKIIENIDIKSTMKFELPSKDIKLRAHIYGEILTGAKFEHDHVYISYLIDTNANWTCPDLYSLTGDTYICQTNSNATANFCHNFYCQLDYKDTSECEDVATVNILSPYLYLETTGQYSWHRFRSEGIGYLALPIYKPGKYEFDIQCCRLLPQNSWERMRRHFIGDYRNFADITWFAIPNENEGRILNKYGPSTVAACNIRIRLNIIHQSSDFGADNNDKGALGGGGDIISKGRRREIALMDRLQSSSAATRDLDKVLDDFKYAKKKMLETRQNVL